MNPDSMPDSPQDESRGKVPNMDPYAVQPPRVYATGDVSVRPTGVTVIAVVCLLAGIVGLLSGIFGLIGLFFGEYVANAFPQPAEAQKLQQQMQAEINAVTQKFFWLTLPLMLIGLLISTCLVAGGIGLLATKPWARVLLRRVLLGAIVIECIKSVTYVFTQLEMGPIMHEYMGKIAGNSGGAGGEAMGQMMQAITYVGIGFMVIWTLAKLAMMAWGSRYLNRPATKEYFQNAVTSMS